MDNKEEGKTGLVGDFYDGEFPMPGINAIIKDIREPKDELKVLEEERGKIYGDPFLSHQAIGLAVEGVIRNRYHNVSKFLNDSNIGPGQFITADLMAEIFAGFKVVRMARPLFHKDSGDDGKVYIDFSQRFRS